jgi:hypothetical protein
MTDSPWMTRAAASRSTSPIVLALVAMLREAARTKAERRVRLTIVEGGKR